MKVTIKDIAKEAEVSIATVSKVLNNKDERISKKTRDLVLKIAKEKNYRKNTMARSLVTRQTKTIGLILPDITNPFFPELARGAEDQGNKRGYNIIFCNTDDKVKKEEKYLNALAEKMVDGIILTQSANKGDTNKIIDSLKLPIILIDRDMPGDHVKGKVLVNNYQGAFTGVEYLIQKGYKKIAFITGPLTTTTAKERLNGYKRAFLKHGIRFDKDLVLEGEYKSQWGVDATKKLLESKKGFDAIFCGNDLIAINVIKTLKKNNIKIPEEVGVLGYDNIYLSEIIEPELSTINQPVYEMGYKAAELLIDILEGKKQGEIIELETSLVIRKSV